MPPPRELRQINNKKPAEIGYGPTAGYERLRDLAKEILDEAIRDHWVIWRGDEVDSPESPLADAVRTFNEACVLMASLSADADALRYHVHHYNEAERCRLCGYDRSA